MLHYSESINFKVTEHVLISLNKDYDFVFETYVKHKIYNYFPKLILHSLKFFSIV